MEKVFINQLKKGQTIDSIFLVKEKLLTKTKAGNPYLSLRLTDRSGEIEGGTFLFDVVGVNPETAWAVGIDGYVIKTTDGGKTWSEVVTGAPKIQLFCIATDRKDAILLGGKGTFLSSFDRGKTWKAPGFRPPITYDWIYGLACRGSSGFVAVGGEGAIYLNASTSWQRVVY